MPKNEGVPLVFFLISSHKANKITGFENHQWCVCDNHSADLSPKPVLHSTRCTTARSAAFSPSTLLSFVFYCYHRRLAREAEGRRAAQERKREFREQAEACAEELAESRRQRRVVDAKNVSLR